MIRINLLPEQYIEKKVNFPVPLKALSVLLLIVMALFWGLIFYLSRNISREIEGVSTELNALAPEMTMADKYLLEMNQQILPKKMFLDQIASPDLEWDRTLDTVSRALPRGVWITRLTFSEFPELLIHLEGLARPYDNRSAVSLIGDFVTRTKKELEDFGAQKTPSLAGSLFRTETFTQQQEAKTQQLTQFIVEFRKKT